MSREYTLRNGYGPEVVPPQTLEHSAPEVHQPDPNDKFVQYSNEPPEVVPLSEKGQSSQHKKILGMRRGLFWALIAFAVVVVLGVGIGVGVGVGVKNQKGTSNSPAPPPAPTIPHPSPDVPNHSSTPQSETSSSASTTAPSKTSATAAPVVTSGTHGIAANSCTFTSPRTYRASDGKAFTEYCFTDWPNGADLDNDSTATGKVTDLSRTIVYTFEACMEACVKYNEQPRTVKCGAVSYNSNLTSIVEEGQQGGNCFLKNGKGAINRQGTAEAACAALVF